MKTGRKISPLNSDELGEKGQAHFKEICADAKLVCNQSDRDRTGWDFIVESDELQTKEGAVAPLESRKVALSCHMQVKTLLDKNDKFEMRLTSAERLAKEPKPSFIYVFKVNDALEYTGAYLIHLRDEPLSKILERLRKEDAARNLAPNKKKISMSASRYGIPLAPTGQALRDALVAACGADLHAYADDKKRQLEELGFEERPYELNMTLPGTLDDLVDVFLGIKPTAHALNLSSTQTRFGIKLPVFQDKAGDISFTPAPADTCTITVRSKDLLSPPAVFQGEMVFPAIPGLPREHTKYLFRTEFFDLVVSADKISIATFPNIGPQTPSTWASYFRLALVMATGSGTIQVSSNTRPISSSHELTAKAANLQPDQCRYSIDICERVSSLLKMIGITQEPKLTLATIFANADHISGAFALAHPEEGPTPFSFTSEYKEPLPATLNMDMLYANFFALDWVIIGYYGVMHVVGERRENKFEWKSDDISLRRMVQLTFLPQQYEELIESAKKETGIENVISRPSDDGEEPAVRNKEVD